MCGRFSQTLTWSELAALYDIAMPSTPLNLRPRYNLAPTQEVAVVRRRDDACGRALSLLRWGLIPAWAKDAAIGAKLINARAETAADKPAFRSAFKARRCLIPADGFYEWQPRPGRGKSVKQPYHITAANGRPLTFAGLWERWRAPDAEAPLDTVTILTTAANAEVAAIHDRMPAILDAAAFAAWLDPERPPAALQALLAPWPGALALTPVSTRVNAVANDDPACREPVPVDLPPLL